LTTPSVVRKKYAFYLFIHLLSSSYGNNNKDVSQGGNTCFVEAFTVIVDAKGICL
jgi:hypothetical protein